jgi:hypothetical protein
MCLRIEPESREQVSGVARGQSLLGRRHHMYNPLLKEAGGSFSVEDGPEITYIACF